MNQHPDQPWAYPTSATMGLDMHNITEEDFADFLNPEFLGPDFNSLGGFDVTSDDVTQQPFGEGLVQSSGQQGLDISARTHVYGSRPGTSAPHGLQQPFDISHPGSIGHLPHGQFIHPSHGEAFDNAMRGAPPTPNSSELYAENYGLFQQQQQLNRSQQPFAGPGADLNTFTPSESPAMDGLQSAVSYVPEYNNPSSLVLSPITSPAMNPQMHPGQTPRSTPRTAGSSAAASPHYERLDAESQAEGGEERPRKTRKKTGPATRSTTSGVRTRKGAKRDANQKDSLNVRIPAKGSAGPSSAKSIAGQDHAESHGHTLATRARESLSNSMSPHPSGEQMMAPPPKPTSAVTTPTTATHHPKGPLGETPNPATPASLMKGRTSGREPGSGSVAASQGPIGVNQSNSTSTLESGMEFLSLPEPAAPATSSGSSNHSLDESASTVAKTNPGVANSAASSESPRPGSTFASPSGPVAMQKSESKGGRGSKKRNSSSSNMVSPALRPKVSPGVKALLPEGSGMDSQTQALLLASRSNYENILSGNHLPGVSYPSDLSVNLTSKRTSHKLAEQGRRNRINDALKEMQTLLPPKFASKVKEAEAEGRSGNQKNGSSVQNGNSKAATVENAIEYIKTLQEDMEKQESIIRQLNEEKEGRKD